MLRVTSALRPRPHRAIGAAEGAEDFNSARPRRGRLPAPRARSTAARRAGARSRGGRRGRRDPPTADSRAKPGPRRPMLRLRSLMRAFSRVAPQPRAPPGAASAFDVGDARRAGARRKVPEARCPPSLVCSGRATLSRVTSRRGPIVRERGGRRRIRLLRSRDPRPAVAVSVPRVPARVPPGGASAFEVGELRRPGDHGFGSSRPARERLPVTRAR
jgi:hypothetical protein